jgi:hypothetical protein
MANQKLNGAVVCCERLDRSVRPADPARRLCRHDHGRRAVACGRLRADGACVLFEPSRLRRAASARRALVTARSVCRRASCELGNDAVNLIHLALDDEANRTVQRQDRKRSLARRPLSKVWIKLQRT